MNKRLKELAKKVGAGKQAGVSGLVFRDDELEKFAKLIILECADISEKHWTRHKGCSAHFSIREHFGVEYEQTNPKTDL